MNDPGRVKPLDGIERKDDYIDVPEYDCMARDCSWSMVALGPVMEQVQRHIRATGHQVRVASVFEVWGPK